MKKQKNQAARRLVKKIRKELGELRMSILLEEVEVNFDHMALEAIQEINNNQLEILDRNLDLFN